jgi:hypothetical protein
MKRLLLKELPLSLERKRQIMADKSILGVVVSLAGEVLPYRKLGPGVVAQRMGEVRGFFDKRKWNGRPNWTPLQIRPGT